jgi:hypothetical protein
MKVDSSFKVADDFGSFSPFTFIFPHEAIDSRLSSFSPDSSSGRSRPQGSRMSSFGTLFRVTTFGESHCPAVGCIVDGVPPRMTLTEADIQVELP